MSDHVKAALASMESPEVCGTMSGYAISSIAIQALARIQELERREITREMELLAQGSLGIWENEQDRGGKWRAPILTLLDLATLTVHEEVRLRDPAAELNTSEDGV